MNQIELKGHLGCINCIIQLSNGNLLTGGDDSSIRIWDIKTYENILTFEEHFARVTCLIEISKDIIASGSFDTSIRLWNLNEKKCYLQLCEHLNWVLCLYILKDYSLCSGGGDNLIIIWNVKKGISKKILKGHSDLINCISQLNNDNIISSSDDKSIRIWDYINGNCIKVFNCNDNIISFTFFNNLFVFRRDHAGFVFQQNYLNDSMSALDNVMVSGLLKTKDRRALAGRAKDLLQKVQIGENDWRKFPTQLSGGQQQRVAVVRGVINQPEVLFADEPTGALNSQNTTNVLDIMTELNNQGQSIVMVTHTVKAAERGNRIIYLSDGVISDECNLGPYLGDYKDENNLHRAEALERHKKLKDFLQAMGW